MTRLVAEQLAKSYPVAGDRLLDVLTDVSLTIEGGASAAILGPSGSGKSTLLAVLGALDPPTGGSIALDGVDPYALQPNQLAKFRGEQIGFVFQDHHLLPQCSVLENVLVPLLANGVADEQHIERARDLLSRVGLAERETHRPAQLSGGERQRTALARALIRSPKLLLADEPTGNLDRSTAEKITQLLINLQREEDAILVAVTHSTALAAQLDRRYELDAGKLQTLS